jgi:hypothetical protein
MSSANRTERAKNSPQLQSAASIRPTYPLATSCTAMHYAMEAGPCAVPYALNRLGNFGCFA